MWFFIAMALFSFIIGVALGFLLGPIFGINEWNLGLAIAAVLFILATIFSG